MTTAPALRHIPLAQILPDEVQIRQEFDTEKQAGMTESIQSLGILTPLQVIDLEDGSFRLLDGEFRWRAAKAIGLETVPCIIREAASWVQARTHQFVANALRQDLTPLEDAQAMLLLWLAAQVDALEIEQADSGEATASLLETCDSPTQEIAALSQRLTTLAKVGHIGEYAGGGRVRVPWEQVLKPCGRSDWTADRRRKRMKLLDLPADIQDALSGVPASARILSKLSTFPADQQQAIVQQIRAHTSDPTIQEAMLRKTIEAQEKPAPELPPQSSPKSPPHPAPEAAVSPTPSSNGRRAEPSQVASILQHLHTATGLLAALQPGTLSLSEQDELAAAGILLNQTLDAHTGNS